MKIYRSHGDARIRGGEDVWPGCGKAGRCMPCGRIHAFDGEVDKRPVKRWACAQNTLHGCPSPKPPGNHVFDENDTCHRCQTINVNHREAKQLTPTQAAMLKIAATSKRSQVYFYGGPEITTAKALARKRLIKIIEPDTATITERGKKIARVLAGLEEST